MINSIKKNKILNYCLLVIFLILFSGFIIKYFTFPVDAALCSCKACSYTGYCSNFQYNNPADCPCEPKCSDHCDCPGCPLYRCTTTTTTKPSTTTSTTMEGSGYKCTTSPGLSCYEVSSGATYSTMSLCSADCFVSYDCNYSTGQCVKQSELSGSYWSKSACDNDCKVTYTYACRSNGKCIKEASTTGYETLAICQACCNSNANCSATTYWKCDESTGTCYSTKNGQFATRISCEHNCGTSTTTKPSGTSGTTTTTTKPSTTTTKPSTTTTLPETQPCMINYFELPERAWVGYPITGKWSASDWCDDCDVDCTPYPECVWKQDSIGTGFDEYKFTLEQSGAYNYTLTCYGEGGIDERTESATVEALNLPWWREIIPVLPGFLRGIWK